MLGREKKAAADLRPCLGEAPCPPAAELASQDGWLCGTREIKGQGTEVGHHQSLLFFKSTGVFFPDHLWAVLSHSPFATLRFKSRSWNSPTLLVGMLNSTTAAVNSLQFPKMLNVELPHDPVIPLKGIYPRELKIYVHTNTL